MQGEAIGGGIPGQRVVICVRGTIGGLKDKVNSEGVCLAEME